MSHGSLHAEPVDPTPWEPEDIVLDVREPPPVGGALASIELGLVGFYQRSIGPKSVQRCPFYLSCSVYADRAIRTQGGFLGLLYAVDRYFLRENSAASFHYTWRMMDDGRVKLDDSWFIEAQR